MRLHRTTRAARLVYEAKGDLRKQSEANLALARETFDRASALAKSSTVPTAQVDSARRDLRVAEAALAAAIADEKAALAQLGGSAQTPIEQVPGVLQAQLAIKSAERSLALTSIAAPFRGNVTGVDSVQLGALISIGQPALALVATDAPWITVAFETDPTRRTRPDYRLSPNTAAVGDDRSATVSSPRGGVAHIAYLGGMLGGFVMIRFVWGRRLWHR